MASGRAAAAGMGDGGAAGRGGVGGRARGASAGAGDVRGGGATLRCGDERALTVGDDVAEEAELAGDSHQLGDGAQWRRLAGGELALSSVKGSLNSVRGVGTSLTDGATG